MKKYLHSLQGEWIKTRHSAASWLVVTGGFFIPAITIFIRLINYDKLPAIYGAKYFWENLFVKSWEIMAFFLLPMGAILATSLITQIEYRNNTWKQVHAMPQSFSTIFFAKLTAIVLMMLQFFLLFNTGIYLSGLLPALFIKNVAYPVEAFPFLFYIKANAKFFIACLPIIALQYLVSLQFKNFLVPLGFGIGLLVAATFAVSWKYGYIVPYEYCLFNFIQLGSVRAKVGSAVNIHLVACAYFIAATIASYILYISKKDKC